MSLITNPPGLLSTPLKYTGRVETGPSSSTTAEYIAKLEELLAEAVVDFNDGLPIQLGWVARVEKVLNASH